MDAWSTLAMISGLFAIQNSKGTQREKYWWFMGYAVVGAVVVLVTR